MGGESIPLVERAGIDIVGETLSFLQKRGFPPLNRWPYDVLLTVYAGIDKAGQLVTDPSELYRDAVPKRRFILPPEIATGMVTKDELLDKISQLGKELKELNSTWTQKLHDVQTHYAGLETKWRQQAEEAQKHYASLEQEWRRQAVEAQTQHVALDASWRRLLEENTEEWLRQKAEYERMLEAYRREAGHQAAASG
jgi:hypothetical protein